MNQWLYEEDCYFLNTCLSYVYLKQLVHAQVTYPIVWAYTFIPVLFSAFNGWSKLFLIIVLSAQKRQLDERIEQIVFRVEEFQQQLLWMHQNVSSTSEKVSIVHAKLDQLKALFERIDQVEVCAC